MSRATLLVLAAPAALLVACSSDPTSGTTSTGAGGAAGTTSAAGTGGSSSTAAAGTGGSAVTTTSGATSSASGSTSTGMAMMGACTNDADKAISASKDVPKIVGDCASSSFGGEPATKNCIKMGTGFSDPCVTCFDDNVGCVIKNCVFQCSSDSGSPDCVSCRAMNCDPAFVMCSGLAAN